MSGTQYGSPYGHDPHDDNNHRGRRPHGPPGQPGPPPRAGQNGPPEGQRPAAGRPHSGGYRRPGPPPSAGGTPSAGRPHAGRGNSGQPPHAGQPGPSAGQGPPNTPGGYPQAGRGRGGAPPPNEPPRGRPSSGRPGYPQSPPGHAAGPGFAPPYDDRNPEDGVDQAAPSEGGAFADSPDNAGFGADESWEGDDGTELIGKLGYVPKEMRDDKGRRSDKKKYKTFQRRKRSNPLLPIGVVVVVLALVGGVGWWIWNMDSETTGDDGSFAYSHMSEPCDIIDLSPVSEWGDADDMDRVDEREPRERSRGWEQSCDYGWSVNNGAGMTVEVESTVFESDSRASNTFDRGFRSVIDDSNWEEFDGDGFGDEFNAAIRGWESDTGTSNYQVHVRDANVYLLVRVTVYDEVDDEELASAANTIAEDYVNTWRENT